MAKVKLGTKWECYSCGHKFYDFDKSEIICPHCGADQNSPERESAVEAAIAALDPQDLDETEDDEFKDEDDVEEGDEEDDSDSDDERPALGEDGDLEDGDLDTDDDLDDDY